MPKDDLWVKYFTSSPKIKELIKEENNFEVRIIYKSLDIEEAYWKEQDYIKSTIEDPLCLNRYYIDRDKNQKIFSMFGKNHTLKTREKMKGRIPWNLGKSIPTGKPSWNKGIPTPPSVKQKIKERTVGIKKSEETKQRMRKPKSEIHSQNISAAALKRPRYECAICKRMITKPNIENHRKIHE
jgi:hypothetical protein